MLPSALAARLWHLQRTIRFAEADHEAFKALLPAVSLAYRTVEHDQSAPAHEGDSAGPGALARVQVLGCVETGVIQWSVPGAEVIHKDSLGNVKDTVVADADGIVNLWRAAGDTITIPAFSTYATNGPTALNAGSSTRTLAPASGYRCYPPCAVPAPIALDGTDPFGAFTYVPFGGTQTLYRDATTLVTPFSITFCSAPASGNTKVGYRVEVDGSLSIYYTACPAAGPGGSYPVTQTVGGSVNNSQSVKGTVAAPTSYTCSPLHLEYEVTGTTANTFLYGADPVTVTFDEA
jgi:hypothetical protein